MVIAEREGFEPSVQENPIRRFSKPVPSATRPSLHDGLPNQKTVLWGDAHCCRVPPKTTCVTLFDYQSHCGGGGFRTPGACARRFSRPLPSTTRPLLQADLEAGGIYRDQSGLVKPDLPFSKVSQTYRWRAHAPEAHRHTLPSEKLQSF